MAAVLALVLIGYGIKWAMTEGFRANRSAVRSRRAGTRQAASQRGTSTHRVGSSRRAARSAGLGYWLHAIRHGFPVERGGIARGWRDHQQAAQTAQTDGTRERAEHEGVLARLRAEAAAHKHRMDVAARQRQQRGHPTMTDQLRTATGDQHMGAPGTTCTNKKCKCHDDDGPIGLDPQTHALLDWQARGAADRMQKIIDEGPTPAGPPLADGKTPGAPAPATNGHGPTTNGAAPVTDTTLDTTSQGSANVKTLADHSSNNPDLEAMIGICDGLDEATNGDRDCGGRGMELVQAIRARQDADRAMGEAAQALQDEVEKYRAIQEGRDASGKELPQDGFVAH